jgi:hypothetical protein
MPNNACVNSNILSGCQILVPDLAGEPQGLFVSMIRNLECSFFKEVHIDNSVSSAIR